MPNEPDDADELALLLPHDPARALCTAQATAASSSSSSGCPWTLQSLRHDVLVWGPQECHDAVADELPAKPPPQLHYGIPSGAWSVIYWGLFVEMYVSVVPGKWTHDLLGQRGQVRVDETPLEHYLRVRLAYQMNGLNFIGLVLDLCNVGLFVATGTITERESVSHAISITFELGYPVHMLPHA